MDPWKFYDVTHRDHVVCNPMSEDTLARLIDLMRLSPNACVVDIACGKGEFLVRLAEAYRIRGTGIDLSPFCIADARKRLQARAPGAAVAFEQRNGADFHLDVPHSLTLASCIGASWVFGGHAATLNVLSGMVEADGWVVVGEPYWMQEPSAEYLAALGVARDAFGTHMGNAEAGALQGLELVDTFASSRDDRDRYEGLQWHATETYARGHPDDPDLPELLQRVAKAKLSYLRWGRDTLGWAMYAFRRRRSRRGAERPGTSWTDSCTDNVCTARVPADGSARPPRRMPRARLKAGTATTP